MRHYVLNMALERLPVTEEVYDCQVKAILRLYGKVNIIMGEAYDGEELRCVVDPKSTRTCKLKKTR